MRGQASRINGYTAVADLRVKTRDRKYLCGQVRATELIHIGQAVLAHKSNLDFFVDAVFNYPTLAETYKVAALDAWNKR